MKADLSIWLIIRIKFSIMKKAFKVIVFGSIEDIVQTKDVEEWVDEEGFVRYKATAAWLNLRMVRY